jgi:hypothetical protein
MLNLLDEYSRFIDEVRKGKSPQKELEISQPDCSLDFLEIFLEEAEENIILSPNENQRHNYAEQVFRKASEGKIIIPEKVLTDVLPFFSHLIPISYKEMQNPRYRINRNSLDKTTLDFSYPEAVLSMIAVKQNKNLILSYNWGL